MKKLQDVEQLSETETTSILNLAQIVSTESDATTEIEGLQLNGQESAVDVAQHFDENGDSGATEESYEFDDVPF